jgi:Zn-dependent protease
MLFHLGLLDDVLRDPVRGLIALVIVLGALLFSLVFHEFSHALVSMALGDYTQRKRGRLSLNPLRHLDPVGTFLILFVGFGWAKPVQTDDRLLKPSPVVGMALVGLAGPFANLLLLTVAALPYRLHLYQLYSSLGHPTASMAAQLIGMIGFYFILWNIVLAVFNLIPIPPLDGSWAMRLLLPRRWQTGPNYARIARWGTFLFIALIGISYVTPISPLGIVISIPIDFMQRLVIGRAII